MRSRPAAEEISTDPAALALAAGNLFEVGIPPRISRSAGCCPICKRKTWGARGRDP